MVILSHYTDNYGQLWLIIASWEPWGALTGANEVSADLLALTDKYFLLVEMCHPWHRHQAPNGVGHVPPGGFGKHPQGKMGYQQVR